MLAFYSRIAHWLTRFRLILWIMFGGTIVAFGWIVLNPVNPEKNPIFLGTVILFGWTLCLLIIQTYFSQPIEQPAPNDSSFLTFKKRLMTAVSWGVALFVTGLAVKMLLLTIQGYRLLSASGVG